MRWPIAALAVSACGAAVLCWLPVRTADGQDGASGAVIRGIVTYRGEIPRAAIPDELGAHRPLLAVDRNTNGLQSVVVFVEPASPEGRLAGLPGPPDAETLIVDQKDHTFLPRIVVARAGQTVRFTNSEPANHNVRAVSLLPANQFNVYTGLGGGYEHRFQADPKGRPVMLGCDIHPWMRAWIYVFDHGFATVTDAAGRFAISRLPPGRYLLEVRQPDVGIRCRRDVQLAGDETVKIDVELTAADLNVR